jgi:hypothetical protein
MNGDIYVMASRTLKTPMTRHAVAALQVEYFVFGKAILFTQHLTPALANGVLPCPSTPDHHPIDHHVGGSRGPTTML